MYLWFVHERLNLFNKTILAVEKTKASATDIVIKLEKLKTNLEERRDNKFIPQGAKKLFKALEENGNINADMITKEFTHFYDRSLSSLSCGIIILVEQNLLSG
jgi:hypothetical protein